MEASEFASAAMASFIDPARIDAARCRACASRSFVTLLNHQEVKSGVRIAVTITEAATCTVAAPATEAYDVSARATACGTAAELPAVLEAAAPAIPVPPNSLSATMHTKPVTVTTVTPRTIPGIPAVATDFRFIVCPRVKAMNGTMIGSCVAKKFLMSSSRLPRIAPATIGAITETIVSHGMTARPVPTKISIVRNGPVSMLCTTYVPASSLLPITLVSARNMPPLVSLIATMTASVLRPIMLPSNNLATASAKMVAVPTLATMMPSPRANIFGAVVTVIFVPTVNRYMPRIVGYPAPVRACVKPPIFSRSGKNVLSNIPMNSGTTIIPPGTRFMNL